jgi:plasmid stabilization system protein ParE
MRYSVVFAPQAEEELAELYGYIAERASPEVAAQFNTPKPSSLDASACATSRTVALHEKTSGPA